MKYIVVGLFYRSRNDCEGDSQKCETLSEAISLRLEWEKSKRYRRVWIMKME